MQTAMLVLSYNLNTITVLKVINKSNCMIEHFSKEENCHENQNCNKQHPYIRKWEGIMILLNLS